MTLSKEITFNLLEDDILHIEVNEQNNLNEKYHRVSSSKKVLKTIKYNSVNGERSFEISNKYILTINNDQDYFRIYDREKQKIIVESYDGFFRQIDKTQKGLSLRKKDDELITGLGQDVEGELYIENVERRCWNEWNGYDYLGSNSIPFYLSNKGYGLFLDTSYPSRFVFGRGDIQPKPIAHDVMAKTPFDWEDKACINAEDQITILGWEEETLDFYIILGDVNEINQKYYNLTGKPSLIPKWSLGYIQCKNRYKSEKEIIHVAEKMRKKEIPCDIIVIDWLWFKEFGDLYWDGENYTNKMKGTIEYLKEMEIKVMLAVHPFVDEDSKNYKDLNKKGCLADVPEGGRPYFDHTNPKTKDEMWKLYQKLHDDGVAAWWTDMGEPESDLPGTKAYAGKREKYHNIYTLLWSKNINEAQKENTGTRNFCLARTNAPGIQNYNTAYWTGDIFATWEIYRNNIKALQTVSISGQPYVCTDIGGFHTDERFTPELYLRWLQWGVFAGIFRVHGVKPENEPWSLGEENEKIFKEIIKLRYRFIPYLYEKIYQLNNQGTRFIRPLLADYPSDTRIKDYKYQYLFGDLMVCPVYEANCRELNVYLPDGKWYDYYNGREYQGGEEYNVHAPLDKIPLFAKSGSIFVNTEAELHVKDIYDNYQLNIFGQKNSVEYIYEDDGNTYDFEKDQYNLIKLIKSGNKLRIETINNQYKQENKERKLEINYYNNNQVFRKEIDYKLETIKEIKLTLDNKEIKQNKFKFKVDISNSKYNGDFKANISIKSPNYQEDALRLKIEKPKSYFLNNTIDLPESLDFSSRVTVEDSADYLYKKIKVDKLYTKTFTFKPFKMYLPQHETIKIYLENPENEEIIASKEITLGNGYLKNWKYSVAKYEDQVNKDNLNFAPYMDSNPWGYIYLHKYLNMQENGIRPIDFIEIIQKVGFAYAKVNILASETKNAYLRIRADEKSEFYLNGKLIHKKNTYTIEEDIKVKLNKGDNLLEAKLSWKNPRPFTGREFGLSAQVLNENKKIDQCIKSY